MDVGVQEGQVMYSKGLNIKVLYKLVDESYECGTERAIEADNIGFLDKDFCLLVKNKVKKGSLLRLEIQLGQGQRVIKLFCAAQWIRQSGGLYDIGIKFISLKKDDLRFLSYVIGESVR